MYIVILHLPDLSEFQPVLPSLALEASNVEPYSLFPRAPTSIKAQGSHTTQILQSVSYTYEIRVRTRLGYLDILRKRRRRSSYPPAVTESIAS